MKNVLKKGLVVLLASMFVSSVFAAEMTATGMDQQAKPAAAAPAPAHKKVVKHHKKCSKAMKKCIHHCKANHGKNCKKHCKAMHKKAVKTAEAAPAKANNAAAPAAEKAQG